MSQTKLEKLTLEQEALIPFYREKWRAIATATEPIEPEKATVVVKDLYGLLSFGEPLVIFF